MSDREADSRLDAALVERVVRNGDTRAFESLVRRHQGFVRAQLRKLLIDDPATADDLAQETFLLAWRKLEQFRGDSRFSTWIFRIAHTCFLQHFRSKGGRTKSPATTFDYNQTRETDLENFEYDQQNSHEHSHDLGLDIASALKCLSFHQRAALLYCAQLGLSHGEAALVLDMPLGTVKTHIARGKARLRELMSATKTEE